MICPRCNVEMKVGIGINPTKADIAKNSLGGPTGLIDHSQLRLDAVWKCPVCGHSADMTTVFEVTKTITKKITRCYDCLYYFNHPRDAECQHPSVDTSMDIYAGVKILDGNAMHEIPYNCPLRKQG